jgi:hypothetical protein
MSYDLVLLFAPAIGRRRMLEYFAARAHYTIDGDNIAYDNPHTQVYFMMRLRGGRKFLLHSVVVAAEFEINYNRPSFFGLEAEKELSAFVAAFRPRIRDPQMTGTEGGTYTSQSFLNGWNSGNAFSIRAFMSHHADLAKPTMPAEALRAVWAWNYDCEAQRDRFGESAFVPLIMFFNIDGRPSRVVVWALGMPIILPRVDFVLIGRDVGNKERYALAPWAEVEEVLRRADIDMTKDPLDLRYSLTPPPIADWVANIPLIDMQTIELLPAYGILDAELVAAARESASKD